MADEIAVFWCERTGEGICSEAYWCECGHATHIEVGRFSKDQRPAFPDNKTITCGQCQRAVRLSCQSFREIYRRADTGEELGGKRSLPHGACYAMDTEHAYPRGFDGRSLVVVLPPDGHHWHIDGRASNCTLPDDKAHRCWVRHGRPEDGTVHVDKNGLTCNAGAGSIQTANWHGFLHNGKLHT